MSYKNKEDMNNYMKERYKKRMLIFKKMLGNRCTICGNTKYLHIDHKNPNKKEIKINKMWNKKLDIILNELKKCQLLCKDCHELKSKKDGSQNINKRNGEQINTAKLSIKDVIYIKTSVEKRDILAKKFSVSPSNISQIRTGKTWKHVKCCK